MKHQIHVQIETSPGQYRRVTAHCESFYDETNPEADHRLEMECALDDAGNYASVPTGFWHAVEAYMWGVWSGKASVAMLGNCCSFFPTNDTITLPLDDQHASRLDREYYVEARREIAVLKRELAKYTQNAQSTH